MMLPAELPITTKYDVKRMSETAVSVSPRVVGSICVVLDVFLSVVVDIILTNLVEMSITTECRFLHSAVIDKINSVEIDTTMRDYLIASVKICRY